MKKEGVTPPGSDGSSLETGERGQSPVLDAPMKKDGKRENQRPIAEAKSQGNAARLQAAFDGAIDAIITIDERGFIDSANPAACRMFGYDLGSMLEKNVSMLVLDSDRSTGDGNLKNSRQFAEKKLIECVLEVTGKHRDGTCFPIDLSISEVKCGKETFFMGIVRDASERKKVELKNSERQAKLSAILENVVEGIITIDESGCIESANEAAQKIFGFSISEMCGCNVKMLMPEPDRDQHDQYLKNYQETKERKIIGIGREVVGRRKDGTVFPLELSVSEIRVGGRLLYTGITRDVSERRAAEQALRLHGETLEKEVNERTQELQLITRRLEASNRHLEDFAQVVSHDLKSPLRGIGTVSQWLRQDHAGQLSDDGLKLLELMETRVARAEQLVSGILDYSRFTRGEFDEKEVELGPLVYEAIQALSLSPDVAIVRPERFPQVKGKPVPLEQVFLNLVSNAIKHNRKKSKRVVIRWSEEPEVWHFEVEDNGPGIPKEYLEKVFEVFQTLETRDDSESTGIGLALVAAIVADHGGRTWVESTIGNGATFHFTLPKLEGEKKQ